MTRHLFRLVAAAALVTLVPSRQARAQETRGSLPGRIRPEWIEAHVRFLADRLLEGRETAARGAELAARYVASQFRETGLVPLGRDSSFLAPVPLRRSSVVPSSASLSLTTATGTTPLELGRDYVLHADKTRESAELSGRVVFVGFGVTAPEGGYDDYRGVDARGAFVAMFMGGPASLPSDERGHYSLLATKEANARAHGAIGIVTLLPAPASELEHSLGQLEGFAWLGPDGEPGGLFFELGPAIRLADRGTAALLEAAGRSLEDVAKALARGPASFPIDARLEFRSRFAHERVDASNVVGLLPGSDPGLRHEHVVYTAHLDHVGVRRPVDGDSVYHGAIDNAGGTAVLMALARAFAEGPRPRRSILFVAVTGEEKGILGSDYFIRHPPVPREAIVANVNLDNFVMLHPIRDFTAYGARYSSLDDDVRRAAERLGVGVSDDPLPGMTIFTRSDHYPFMRQGVPGLMLFPGRQTGDGTRDGVAMQRAWFSRFHHSPRDRADQGIDWEAGAAYAQANLLIGASVANAATRPAWRSRFFFHEPGRGPAVP